MFWQPLCRKTAAIVLRQCFLPHGRKKNTLDKERRSHIKNNIGGMRVGGRALEKNGILAAGAQKSMWAALKAGLKRDRFLLLILLLPLAYYAIFCYYPMYGITIAFKNFNARAGIIGSEWVGLKHFSKFITDPYFYQIFRNTVLLSFYDLLFGFPAPIILALLLNEIRSSRFKRVAQSVFYLPHFISIVVLCSIISSFMSIGGVANNIISAFMGERVQFLNEPAYFRTIYVASGIWQGVGWGSIIYLAAMSNINPELYEAATVDGAGIFSKMRRITLPCMMPTISVMLILAVGKMMSVNTEKVLLYRGSTYSVADVISTYVYRRGIAGADFEYATAVGLFQSVVAAVLLVATNQISKLAGNESLF
jgi:putative aldouronate transport system permease protein